MYSFFTKKTLSTQQKFTFAMPFPTQRKTPFQKTLSTQQRFSFPETKPTRQMIPFKKTLPTQQMFSFPKTQPTRQKVKDLIQRVYNPIQQNIPIEDNESLKNSGLLIKKKYV